MPLKLFFCYAHEDEPLLNKLKSQLSPLKRGGLIDLWHDRDISPGIEWEQAIDRHLNEAQIILLLVSPDFINSDYCYSIEMQQAIQRHEQGEACVIPVILRHVHWKETPLGKLQALPRDAKPVKSWIDEDEAFYNVVAGIYKAVEALIKKPEVNLQSSQQTISQGLADAMTTTKEAIQLEKQFAENQYTGSGAPFIIINGSIPIILSCPHAVKHPRGTRIEVAETFTGALTLQLASLTQAHALIYARTSQEDPNYDADGPYKEHLRELVRESRAGFVLDIHGIARDKPMQAAIGTAHGTALLGKTNLLNILQEALQEKGLKDIAIDDPRFAAFGSNTITSFVSGKLQIPALQLEIHKNYRNPGRNPYEYMATLKALSGGLLRIAKLL